MMSSLGCKLASFAINSYYDASSSVKPRQAIEEININCKNASQFKENFLFVNGLLLELSA